MTVKKSQDNKASEQKKASSKALTPDIIDMSGYADEASFFEALAFITRYHGHAHSVAALKEGLPIEQGSIAPDILCKAAFRSGLEAELVKRGLSSIPEEILPVIIMQKDRKSLVLLDNKGRVYNPETLSEETVKIDKLEKGYSGYVLFLRKTEEEELSSKKEGLAKLGDHWFWREVWENRVIYRKAMLAAVLINLFALTSPMFVMNVYDRVLPNNAVETGWVLAIGALSVFVFDFVIRILRGYFIDIAGRKSDVILARKIFDHVLDMKLEARSSSTGAFANNLREFESIRDFFTSATLAGFVDFPFVLFFLLIIWFIGGSIAYMLFGLFVIVMIVGMILQVPIQESVRKSMYGMEQKHGLLVETLNSLETLKAVGGSGRFRSRYGYHVGESAFWGQRSRFLSGISVHFSTFIQQTSGIFIILMGMYMVQDGTLSVGGLIACVILGSRALAPVGQVATLVNQYHQARSALNNLNNIMAMPVERPVGQRFLHRPELKGGFVFQKVGFSYPQSPLPVLDNITFQIKPGEKVGIVGRVGSGKSTILKLMTDFYQANQGTILVDGTDMYQIDPADLRRNMSYLAQDTTLFSGTVRENIVVGKPDAIDEEVLQASQLAGVHEFIRRHPLGYDAPVGEGGTGFSGGQRQAIAIARALLVNPPILICDEPTNAMDNQAEAVLIRNLSPYVKEKTFILVTHRMTMLTLVERLILVDNGKILMDGPKEKVLEALKNGKLPVQSI